MSGILISTFASPFRAGTAATFTVPLTLYLIEDRYAPPTFQLSATSIAQYTFGTAERSPAFPPLPPSVPIPSSAVEHESLNLTDRLISARPAETCILPGSRLLPAGSEKMMLASSADAA